MEKGVGDKGYDSDRNRRMLHDSGIEAVIPPVPQRVDEIPFDRAVYRERNQVERLVGRLKQFRRIATRYEKLAATFLALIHLAAAVISVSKFVNTT